MVKNGCMAQEMKQTLSKTGVKNCKWTFRLKSIIQMRSRGEEPTKRIKKKWNNYVSLFTNLIRIKKKCVYVGCGGVEGVPVWVQLLLLSIFFLRFFRNFLMSHLESFFFCVNFNFFSCFVSVSTRKAKAKKKGLKNKIVFLIVIIVVLSITVIEFLIPLARSQRYFSFISCKQNSLEKAPTTPIHTSQDL